MLTERRRQTCCIESLLTLGLATSTHDERRNHGRDFADRSQVDAARAADRGVGIRLAETEHMAEDAGTIGEVAAPANVSHHIVDDAVIVIAIESAGEASRALA